MFLRLMTLLLPMLIALPPSAKARLFNVQKKSKEPSSIELNKAMNELVKLNNRSPIVKNLLSNLKMLKQKRFKKLPIEVLKRTVPKMKWDSKSKTMKYSNGNRLKVISVTKGIYELNGVRKVYPRDFFGLSAGKGSKQSASLFPVLFGLFPQAYAEEQSLLTPANCRRDPRAEFPAISFGAGLGAMVGAQLQALADSERMEFGTPSCQEQAAAILRMNAELENPLLDFYCSESLNINTVALLTIDGRAIYNNMQSGTTDLVIEGGELGPNGASEATFFHTSERDNDSIGFRSPDGVGVLYCSPEAPYHQRWLPFIANEMPMLEYISENLFCQKCSNLGAQITDPNVSSDLTYQGFLKAMFEQELMLRREREQETQVQGETL